MSDYTTSEAKKKIYNPSEVYPELVSVMARQIILAQDIHENANLQKFADELGISKSAMGKIVSKERKRMRKEGKA